MILILSSTGGLNEIFTVLGLPKQSIEVLYLYWRYPFIVGRA